MDKPERVSVERLYVAIRKLRPIVRAIVIANPDLGYRLTKLLDGFEAEVRASL